MASSASAFWSTVARKILLAVTGLGLSLFVLGHLAGNLLLFVSSEAFNSYSNHLISLGPLLVVIELGLLAFFLIHIFTAALTTWKNWRSRGKSYSVSDSRGGPSRMTIASKTMIWSGLVILIFLVFHVITLKYGPGIEQGYVTTIDGEQVRDLYRLVVQLFSDPLYTLFYVVSMGFLGLHLSHGIWSAVQSLGGFHRRLTPIVYGFGFAAALAFAVGFLVIPVWFYFGGGSLS
jgi:succinate dehydrogenase / fumarate reductase cytochrome b subunit